MKYFTRTMMIAIFSLACVLTGAAQNANSSSAMMDRQARKQAERDRKEAERRRKEEEQAAQRQAGIRCSRLHKKN